MKLSQYILLFLSIAAVFLGAADSGARILQAGITEKLMMDEYVGQAADDALKQLVIYDDGAGAVIEKEAVVDRFFLSLFSSLAILDDGAARAKLMQYIPVMAVTDYDGFYIRYAREKEGTDGVTLEYVWTDKQYYTVEDEWAACRFEKDNTVLLCDKTGILTGTVSKSVRLDYRELSGSAYERFQKAAGEHFLLSEEAFRAEKRNTITRKLEEQLRYYCTAHNRIARKLGIGYEFAFPDMDAAGGERAVPDIGLLIVFQGYPLKDAGGIPYERFLLSGAYIKKTQKE